MIKLTPNNEIQIDSLKAVILYENLSAKCNDKGEVKYDFIVLFSNKIHVILGIDSVKNLTAKLRRLDCRPGAVNRVVTPTKVGHEVACTQSNNEHVENLVGNLANY